MRMWREEKGQAVVEFSLVISLLLLVLLGIYTFGNLMHASLVVTYAAREGARVAALGGTDAEVSSAVLAAVPPTLNQAVVTTTVAPAPGARPRGTPITVTVSYPIDIDARPISDIIGNQITLRGVTTMRAE